MEVSNGKDENKDWTRRSAMKPKPNVIPGVCVKASRWALSIEGKMNSKGKERKREKSSFIYSRCKITSEN